MEKINGFAIGDYGRFSFTKKFKRKYTLKNDEKYFEFGYEIVAEVIEIDKLNILIKDNDEIEHLIERKRIRGFWPLAKPGAEPGQSQGKKIHDLIIVE